MRKAKITAHLDPDVWVEVWKLRKALQAARRAKDIPSRDEALEVLLLHPRGWQLLRDSKQVKEPMPPREGPAGNRHQKAAKPTRYI